LKNLDDLVKDLGGEGAFSGASLSLARYNDHFYTLPWCTAPVVMWYRKESAVKKVALGGGFAEVTHERIVVMADNRRAAELAARVPPDEPSENYSAMAGGRADWLER